jgi:hypothetical protein
MLKEGYLAKLKTYSDSFNVVVTRTSHSVLAPSQELFDDYKNKRITWDEFEVRYS